MKTKITIPKLKQMLIKWKQGNLKIIPKLELYFAEIKDMYKVAYSTKDWDIMMEELVPRINEFYIAGYEPVLCLLEEEYGWIPYNEKGWGDYYNEFSHIMDYIRNDDLNGLRKKLRSTPVRSYEERYLGTFYDIPSKTLLCKYDPRVVKINEIANELNSNFKIMSLDQFNAKCKELIKIIYNR